MTEWKNNIETYDSALALTEINYAGRTQRQRNIVLLIDWENKTVSVETRSPDISGIPSREYFGIVTTVYLPLNVDASYIHAYVDDLITYLEDVSNHCEIYYQDGVNKRIRWDDYNYPWEIEQYIQGIFDSVTHELPGIIDVWDYVVKEKSYKNLTNEEIEQEVSEIESDALSSGVILDGDVRDVLESWRDKEQN